MEFKVVYWAVILVILTVSRSWAGPSNESQTTSDTVGTKTPTDDAWKQFLREEIQRQIAEYAQSLSTMDPKTNGTTTATPISGPVTTINITTAIPTSGPTSTNSNINATPTPDPTPTNSSTTSGPTSPTGTIISGSPTPTSTTTTSGPTTPTGTITSGSTTPTGTTTTSGPTTNSTSTTTSTISPQPPTAEQDGTLYWAIPLVTVLLIAMVVTGVLIHRYVKKAGYQQSRKSTDEPSKGGPEGI